MGLLAPDDWSALWVTAKLATVTTVLLLLVGTPVAWWLSRTQSRLRGVVAALAGIPLVLPPTVLGFYLLVLLGPTGPIGRVWEAWGGPRLVFSFAGLVIGSAIYSLPFVVQPLHNGFAALGTRPLEVAATLGAGPLNRFFRVAVPLARPAFVTAGALAFAHTVGEFGVVLMIGGNIPGRTRVASVAVYDHVERLSYGGAHAISAILLGFAFVVLLFVYSRAWVPAQSRR
jgi:molybdate transport system permease protein